MVPKLVSVVIPTYKNKESLKKSVDSVLDQSYQDIEIFVIDDNSPNTDSRKETEFVMAKYADNPRVHYIQHKENKNGAAARNTGINASKGDYIAFLDDDDIFFPDKIKKQVNYLDTHLEYDATYCYAQDSDKTMIKTVPYMGDVSKQLLLMESNMFTPSLMFRRESLLSINGFDDSFRRHQDYELLLRFFDAGYKMGCVPEVLIELGGNGQNEISGKKLEELKILFFEKFNYYINKYDNEESGYAQRVYAKHYAMVFLRYLKNKDTSNAIRVFKRHFRKSPRQFCQSILWSIKAHLF